MYLNNIKITNFRCFKEYSIELAPRITILYGLNGAGKSTLIHAIHKALSFVMASDTTPDKKERHSITGGITKLKVEGFSTKGDFYLVDDEKKIAPLMEISAQAECNGEHLEWAISAYTNKGKARKTAYMPAFKRFYKGFEQTDKLPVLAFYSDGFPHVEDRKVVSEKVASLRSFGYYDWNNDEGCSKVWIERMERKIKLAERLERRLREYDQYAFVEDSSVSITSREMYEMEKKELTATKQELAAISQCFKTFSSGDEYMEVASIELGTYDDQLCLRTTKAKSFSFRQLPAGYKRMFYILMDIVYRSYILNKTTDAEGVVMIDEIDLHLHPGLEKVVLNRFAKVFPHLQLIVSTHSPLVITSVKTAKAENRIYCMKPNEEAPRLLPDVFGLDYNSSLEDIMSVSATNEELQNMVILCAYMIKNHLDEQAENLKESILVKMDISAGHLEEMLRHELEGGK